MSARRVPGRAKEPSRVPERSGGDGRAPSADLGFRYRARKNGEVEVLRDGRTVTLLRGRAAAKFLADVTDANESAAQQRMARVTGQYARGNERTASRHPRHRG